MGCIPPHFMNEIKKKGYDVICINELPPQDNEIPPQKTG